MPALRAAPLLAALVILGPFILSQSRATTAAGIDPLAREAFVEVYPEVERGNWSAFEALDTKRREALHDYVLWPDLKAASLRANLKTVAAANVEAFLDEHGASKPGRQLRYRYALELARRGHHTDYLELYRSYYQGRDLARLDCHALAAEIALGETWRVAGRALDLWMTAESQVDECDPVFDWLTDAGHLKPEHYRQRFALTIEAREFNRARWLGKQLGPDYVSVAEAWQSAARDPAAFLSSLPGKTPDAADAERALYALERLTYADPDEARQLLDVASKHSTFSAEERAGIERHIALWTARDGLADAYPRLAALPEAARDTEVLRWRARTSLANDNWQRLIEDITAMPPDEGNREEWQYWLAIAHENTGEPERARGLLLPLADERSYYGFLAADALGAAYAFGAEPLVVDRDALDRLAARPELVRARELFLTGLESRGRSEWDAYVRTLPPREQEQAALLAHRWGWHSRAIATAARRGHFNDLEIRYPLPWSDAFATYADAASIPATWAYGVARSESLFMRDVRSRAGAVGLMQLMPATGRAVAAELSIDYEGLNTLTDPATNIRLGTTYLGRMTERFAGNRVLATAAYNAGPHRVDAWLPESAPVDTRAWIENIPFNETRKYVRRVFAAETIFHWRMTGETRRLSDVLSAVLPSQLTETVASLDGGDVTEPHLDQ